jgi:YD repeat-containing protein
MKKIKIHCMFLTCFILCSASNIRAQGVKEYLSETGFLPPSPNSASLGKYGGVNLGLSAGTMQQEIPLANLPFGKSGLPISITYSSNGVKVNEIASRVGTSWNLQAGGVITRTVYGEPDEIRPRISVPNLSDRSRTFINFLDGLVAENGVQRLEDGEADVFSFNFNGHSGRFVLDANLNPILLTYSGIKIERIDNSQFQITTTEGVKYRFGGAGALETQRDYSVGQGCGRTFPNLTVTAYYLKSISPPIGETVNFQYSSINYSYTADISSTNSKRDISMPANFCPGLTVYPPPDKLTSCLRIYQTSTPILNEISSTSGNKVKLYYKSRKDVGDVLLDYLEVYQPSSTTWLKKVKLEYLQAKSTHTQNVLDVRLQNDSTLYYRPFLTQVKEISQNSLKEKTYTFSYFNLASLTPRLSYAQDLYGYYNGAIGNRTAFSTPSSETQKRIFPDANANRKIDSVSVSTGLLQKIVYPTGGTDIITYESNKIYSPETIEAPFSNENVSVSGTGTVGIGTLSSADIIISASQEAILTGSCDFNPNGGEGDPSHYKGIVELLRDGVVVLSKTIAAGESFSTVVQLSAGAIYKMKITASRGSVVNTSANLMYKKDRPSIVYANHLAAGARVSSTATNPLNGSSITKRYVYASLDNISKSSGISIFKPIYERYRTVPVPCASGTPVIGDSPGSVVNCDIANFYFYTLDASSLNNIYAFSGSPVYYSAVIEENWDNLSRKGGSEHHFQISPNTHGQQLLGEEITTAPLIDNSWTNGKETYLNQFKDENSKVISLQEIFTHYKQDSRKNANIKSYVAIKKFDAYCQNNPVSQSELDAYDFLIYDHNQVWIYADSVLTRSFDQNGIAKSDHLLISEYGNPTHALPTSIISSNSNGSQDISYTSYSSDYTDASGFIKDMQNANLLSSPIEQVRFNEMNSIRTISSGVIIKYLPGGKGLIDELHFLEFRQPFSQFKFSNSSLGSLPFTGTILSFAPSNFYKQRIKYNSYDGNGKNLQYTVIDGTSTSYIWGYKGQYPIAEVTNALVTDIAYTSFDAEDNGNWNYSGNRVEDNSAPIGSFSYNLSAGAISKSGLITTKTYELHYWTKGTGQPQITGGSVSAATVLGTKNGWTQYRRTISGATSITITGNGIIIDDLRLCPLNAHMTTYSYDPLVGLTSQTDAKGMTIYYEYDEFQRLKVVRDQNGSIVKTYQYNYKQ